jgi:small acid-soluble spore protein I (minor)
MNFNIRGAVMHNIQKMDEKELVALIQDSIQKGDEKYLPGLGVLFEVIWNHSEGTEQEEMIQTLHQQLGDAPSPFM